MGKRYFNKSTAYHEEYKVGKPAENKGSDYDPKLSGRFLLPREDVAFVFISIFCSRPGPHVGQPRPQTGPVHLESEWSIQGPRFRCC